jgi:hypothetical protein
MAGQAGDLPHVFRIVSEISGGVSPEGYQRAYEIAGPNDVAAMPSLHMAVTFIIAFMAWRLHRVAGALALFYAGSMAFVLVYLGEHYVTDLLAGLLMAVVVWKLVCWWWQQASPGRVTDRVPESQGQPVGARGGAGPGAGGCEAN